jgi:hypothetical protein
MPTVTIAASDLESEITDGLEVKIDSIQFYCNRQPDIEYTLEGIKDIEVKINEDDVLDLIGDCRFNENHLEQICHYIPNMVAEYPDIAIKLVQDLLVNMNDQVLHQIYDSIKFRVPDVEKISFWKKMFGK